MIVTLLGIVTLVRSTSFWNDEFPMLMTGRPPIVPGMVKGPPAPIYPVMVILLLLVV